MITLNQMVYEIRNIYKLYADDTLITNRLLAQYIKEARAKLLEEDITKGKIISDEFIQNLSCVNFEKYNFEDTCLNDDFTIQRGNTEIHGLEACLMRSTCVIPHTIQRNSRNSIVAVQAVDLSKDYSETTFVRYKYNKYNRFTANSVRWFIKDNYIYLTNTNEITRLSISGIFANPEDVSSFTTCSGSPCFNWDSPYPIAAGMVKRVVDIVLKERLNISQYFEEDKINDTDDNAEQKARR